jgi:rubrerythrin
MLGISAPVKEIVWYCEECGTVMNRSRDPELLERYRWHTS